MNVLRWLVMHRGEKEPTQNFEYKDVLLAFIESREPSTQLVYKPILKLWEEFLLTKNKIPTEALPLHADLFIKQLSQRKGIKSRGKNKSNTLSKRTIFKYISILKKFYDVLEQSKLYAQINPFLRHFQDKSKYETLQKRPTEMVNFDVVMKLINLPDKNTKRGRRDIALLSLFFGCGFRRNEVIKLNINDLEYNGKHFEVRLINTKNGEDLIFPVAEFFNEALLQYIEQRRNETKNLNLPLFVDYYRGDGNPSESYLNPTTIRNMFKKYASELGFTNATPHSARATAISKLLKDGLKHREVQDFSRHKSIQMVEVYDKNITEVHPAKKIKY